MSCCGGARPKYQGAPRPPALTVQSAKSITQGQFKEPAPDYIIERRLQTCKACPNFESTREMCTKCGCLIAAKVGPAKEKCPIGKW